MTRIYAPVLISALLKAFFRLTGMCGCAYRKPKLPTKSSIKKAKQTPSHFKRSAAHIDVETATPWNTGVPPVPQLTQIYGYFRLYGVFWFSYVSTLFSYYESLQSKIEPLYHTIKGFNNNLTECFTQFRERITYRHTVELHCTGRSKIRSKLATVSDEEEFRNGLNYPKRTALNRFSNLLLLVQCCCPCCKYTRKDNHARS